MFMKKGKIYIGTSGWHYKHWKGTFYPAGTKNTGQFDFYKDYFNTVEINNSFYHFPLLSTFRSWHRAAPPRFLFSVKANRFCTHLKKLHVERAGIVSFLSLCRQLKEKLGPVLFQLPPRWKVNEARLEAFLQMLPNGYRYVFEFRNDSWYTKSVFDMLSKYNCAFCVYELAGHRSPVKVTADFVYVRLHGPGVKKYQGSYSSGQLRKWAKKCKAWQLDGRDVFFYFDNDEKGYAPFNAQELNAKIHKIVAAS